MNDPSDPVQPDPARDGGDTLRATAATPPAEGVDAGPIRGPFGGRVYSLGRLFGIEVGVDPSWVVVFVLFVLFFQRILAGEHADWPAWQSWSGGLAACLLFFASILLHELGHSLTSKRFGLPVISITLFLFGGLAQLAREPERPRDAFLIAVAGPLVSVLLGLGFLLLWLVLPAGAVWSATSAAVFKQLGVLNVLLAAFNAVPGFPLDGGHMLRAAIWAATRDFERATRVAATVGATFAQLLIGLGVVIAIAFGQPFNGLWLVFIGWFLLRAARGSSMQSFVRTHLGHIRVSESMSPDLSKVDAWNTVEDVLTGPVLRQGKSFLFVESDGELVGLVTVHEIRRVPAKKRPFTRVATIMVPRERLFGVTPEQTLLDALLRMERRGIHEVPVLDGEGRPVGELTRDQILRVLHQQLAWEGKR